MSETAEELPRVLQQLWGMEGPARPGPKPTFHISDIGAAAIKLADEAGLGAVSMSKVAAALGFTTMSLYRYVDSKDDLYVVMLEEAFGRPGPQDPGGDLAGADHRVGGLVPGRDPAAPLGDPGPGDGTAAVTHATGVDGARTAGVRGHTADRAGQPVRDAAGQHLRPWYRRDHHEPARRRG